MRRSVAFATQVLLFFAAGLIVAWPSLNYPWYNDDLHQLRVFSPSELLLVWHHSWDLDGYEAVGYRPLTVLFNHIRMTLFGESMVEHRLFMVALFAGYLALIAAIGRRFGLSTAATTLAGIMMLTARYSTYHFILMTDGVHVEQGIVFALAALAILRWVDTQRPAWLYASVAWFVVSVLVREDSIAQAPVLVILAAMYGRRARTLAVVRDRLIAYGAVLAVISVAAFAGRLWMAEPGTEPPWTPLKYLAAHVVEVVTLAGWQPVILLPLFVGIFALVLLALARWKGDAAETAWMWLVCAALSCTPGIVEARVNLLFFAMTFYCLCVAQVLVAYARGQERHFGTWGRPVAIAAAVICIALPARESRLQQLGMAPGSADHIETGCDIMVGGEWAAVTPPLRRDAVLREMARLGITAGDCASLIDASRAVRLDATLPEAAFFPPRRFLSR